MHFGNKLHFGKHTELITMLFSEEWDYTKFSFNIFAYTKLTKHTRILR